MKQRTVVRTAPLKMNYVFSIAFLIGPTTKTKNNKKDSFHRLCTMRNENGEAKHLEDLFHQSIDFIIGDRILETLFLRQ